MLLGRTGHVSSDGDVVEGTTLLDVCAFELCFVLCACELLLAREGEDEVEFV